MSLLKKIEGFNKKLPILFFLGVFFLYFHNLTRDIYSGDIGDLVTASCLFGVSHPPGYPLFTFLGGLLCHLPILLPPVSKVALLSLFSSFFGVIIYHRFCMKITKSIFLSLLSSSILAFLYFYWVNAEIPEVFALNGLFVIVLLTLAVLFSQEKKLAYLYFLAFFSGLSLTHHQTILFIFPSLLILVLKHTQRIISNKKTIGYSALFFILGLVPYLYVPIAASHNPMINWDQVSSFQSFAHLILRQDYGGFAPIHLKQPVPFQIRYVVTGNFFNSLLILFSYQILFVIIVGALYLLRLNKLLFFSLFIAFIISGPLFTFYGATFYTTKTSFGIIERFYLLPTIVLVFFIPYGFMTLKNIFNMFFSKEIYSLFIIGYFLLIPILLIKYNFPRTDISKTKIGETLAKDILTSLPKNSILYVSGDTTTFNIWYAEYILKIRSDIDIINPPGVGGNAFLDNALTKYHTTHPHEPLSLLLSKTIDDLRKKRPIFSTYQLSQMPSHTVLLPLGLVYEVIDKKTVPSEQTYINKVWLNLKTYHKIRRETLAPFDQNFVTPEIPLIYSNALVRIGDFMDSYYKDPQKAEQYYRSGLWLDNENPSAYAGLGLVQYKAYTDCHDSIVNLSNAIDLFPIWKTYYRQKYLLYKKCNYSSKIIDNFKKDYYRLFQEDIGNTI